MKVIVLGIAIIFISCNVLAAKYSVKNLKVQSIAQEADDEEAPLLIRSLNKFHKCGGKSSNLFVIHSEYEYVATVRFNLVLEAMRNNWAISVSTHGCEGKALVVNKVRLEKS